jgi:hypothetical protein
MKKSELTNNIREVLSEKQKGVDGKACWKGYRYAGTKNGKDICIKIIKEKLDASTPAPNEIPGGLAQFSTIGDLATMHNLPLDQIIKQIIKGVKAESEHTTDLDIAMEIAFDHVYEDPKYYDKLANMTEGKHDPVEPGILKKRLGKLTCSKVRAAKAGLEDKGTHYAKALQRYLNYHCQ